MREAWETIDGFSDWLNTGEENLDGTMDTLSSQAWVNKRMETLIENRSIRKWRYLREREKSGFV